jgi:hypothetical protein
MPGIQLGYSEIETINSDAKPHRTPKALRAGTFERAEKIAG